MAYEVWVVVHLLVIGYWLGTDLAVYYLSGAVADSGRPIAERTFAARAMLFLDMLPRTCLILTLLTGLVVAGHAYLPAPVGGWWWVWPLLAGWLALTWAVFLAEGNRWLSRIDSGIRVLVVAVLCLLASSVWAEQAWLGAKLGLLAFIMVLGLVVRVQLKPFGPLFARVAGGEADEATEQRLAGLIARVKIPVYLIWASIIAAAFLGRLKPALG